MTRWLVNLFRRQEARDDDHAKRAQRELAEAQRRLEQLKHELDAIEAKQ